MNIYYKKQLWKVLLGVMAMLIIGFSFYYTNNLVQNISKDERKKAVLWAQAIREKAELVKYTNDLFEKLEHEERKKGELWASGMKKLTTLRGNEDVSFIFEVVKNNETVPVILTDEKGEIISSRNLDPEKSDDIDYLKQELQSMARTYSPIEINILNKTKNYLYYKDSKLFSELKIVLDNLISSFISEVVTNSASVPVIYVDSSFQKVLAYGNLDSAGVVSEAFLKENIELMLLQNEPIPVELSGGVVNYILYQNSHILTQLKYYPYIQFSAVGLFIILSYFLFSLSRKAEQNQVWVGMSKETAHQLGTPISSLIAWIELLEDKYGTETSFSEMKQDIKRLETITDRFSKIGSSPKLEAISVVKIVEEAVNYLQSRISKQVNITVSGDAQARGLVNIPLFEWVIENITKNAVDAMDGKGQILFQIIESKNKIVVDIIDSGKGIPKSKFKTVFKPGFTTKQRGWGLGLSLVKRIIENYHRGKIFVKNSNPNQGTTFRIVLNK